MSNYEQALQRCADRMPAPLDPWIRALGLEEELAYILFTSTTWTKHCAFEDTSADNQAIASMDLSLWLFALDDYAGDDYVQFFERCARLLDRRQDPQPETKLLRAFREVIERVEERGAPMTRFIADRHRLMECYRRRNAVRAGAAIDYDEYFEIRKTTVYVDHWISIWEILDDFYLSEKQLDSRISDLVLALKTWHILENEIKSLPRDIEEGTPNLARLLHARQTNRPLSDCVEELRSRRDDAGREYDALRATFPGSDHEPRVHKYVAFLDRSMFGGKGNYEDNQERYRDTAVAEPKP